MEVFFMDIQANLGRIFDLYRKNFLVILGATFLTFLLSGLSLGLLAGPLNGGLIILCLKLSQGKQTTYKEIFQHFDRFIPTFLLFILASCAFVLIWIISGIPLIGWLFNFTITPALYLITGLALAFTLDHQLPTLAAIKRSVEVCLTAPKTIYLYSLVIGLLGSLGAWLFLLPVIFTAPITLLGIALVYQEFSARETKSISLNLNLGRKEKRIGLAVLSGLFLIGLIFRLTSGYHLPFLGRSVFKRNQTQLSDRVAGKILSSITGGKVEVDMDGSSFKFGEMTVGNQLPKGYPRDVPIYSKAEIQSYLGVGNGENSTTTFSTKEQPETVIAFYQRELSAHGWKLETSNFGELTIILGEKKDGRSCSVTISPSENEETSLILTLKRETASNDE
jgi:hypothetical protein